MLHKVYLKAHSQVWENYGCWKPFKNDEECFLFDLKSHFLSQYLNFCVDFLVMQLNGLTKNIRLISNFMTSKHGEQTIVIKTLLNISKIKSSLTMKFGQLIEYNMKNIFPEKSYKMWWRTSPRSFSVKLKLSISLDQ